MSVRDRIDDGMFLWEAGRREGAFLCVLAAVAATARQRYPQKTDRHAFEDFLTEASPARCFAEFRDECHPVEHIIYKWLRCELVHEGGLPVDIEFIPDFQPGNRGLRAGGAPEYLLKITESWFLFLVNCVQRAPEVAHLFGDRES